MRLSDRIRTFSNSILQLLFLFDLLKNLSKIILIFLLIQNNRFDRITAIIFPILMTILNKNIGYLTKIFIIAATIIFFHLISIQTQDTGDTASIVFELGEIYTLDFLLRLLGYFVQS